MVEGVNTSPISRRGWRILYNDYRIWLSSACIHEKRNTDDTDLHRSGICVSLLNVPHILFAGLKVINQYWFLIGAPDLNI